MRLHLATVTIALAACASPSPDIVTEASPRPATQDRVVGLISLPQVFGDHPCAVYVPSEVVLYAEPDSAHSLGVIRVAQPWTMHENGGCAGLRVVVHLESAESAAVLPTLEYGYETPAAVVLDQHDDWFRIRLADGAAWIRGDSANLFMDLEDLLAENLTYIAEPDGKGLSSVPGSTDRNIGTDLLSTGRSVELLDSRRMNGELWLKVAVHNHSPCISPEDLATVAEGWLPAHSQTGEPTVWFYSRGC
jgi:hypothetical protein